jgi:hypothetical protein
MKILYTAISYSLLAVGSRKAFRWSNPSFDHSRGGMHFEASTTQAKS